MIAKIRWYKLNHVLVFAQPSVQDARDCERSSINVVLVHDHPRQNFWWLKAMLDEVHQVQDLQ